MADDDQPQEPAMGDENRGVYTNSAIMAVGTIVSRFSGILRDIALTAALGLTIVRDTYNLGNSLPNIIYILIVGGALNAVFVPQLVRRMKDDADGGKAYADALLSATGGILFVVSVGAVLAAPLIVAIYATPSYTSEQVSLAVAFARYCLPQIFFYGIYTMVSQVLNARGVFGPPMFAPIVNNIVAIATYLGFIAMAGTTTAATGELSSGQVAWLGIGTSLGVALQALVLLPVMVRAGYSFGFSRRWRGLGLGKAARLAGWTIGLVLVNQIALVVVTRLATQANVNALEAGLPPAGLATYQTAYLMFQLPHGVIAVSIVTALLPGLSRMVHAGRLAAAAVDIGAAIRSVILLVTPIAIVLILAGEPLAQVLFGYGAADAEQVAQLGTVTAVFAFAIVPFSTFYVLLRGWYAVEDTRTPFFLALVLQVIHVAVAVAAFPTASPGANQVNVLAAAYSVAHWVILLVAWPLLARRYGGLPTYETVRTGVRILIAAVLAAAVSILVTGPVLGPYNVDGSKLSSLVYLGATTMIVMIVYFGVVWFLRVAELRTILSVVRQRLSRKP